MGRQSQPLQQPLFAALRSLGGLRGEGILPALARAKGLGLSLACLPWYVFCSEELPKHRLSHELTHSAAASPGDPCRARDQDKRASWVPPKYYCYE